MEVVLFLAKPLCYVLAFALAAKAFASSGPHHRAKPWVVVLLAALARLVLGVPGGLAALAAVDGDRATPMFYAVIFGAGLALWLVTAKVAFRRAGWPGLLLFAVIAEAVSGTIDVVAWRAVGALHVC